MNNKLILPAFLILAVGLAGCTQPSGLFPSPPTNGTDGDGGGGGDTTTGAYTPKDGLSITFDTSLNKYNEGEQASFTATVRNTGDSLARDINMTLYGATWATKNQYKTIDSLQAYDKINDLVVGRQSVMFNRQVDVELSPGRKDTYQIFLQTKYDYNSTTRSQLTVMSSDQFQETGQSRSQMTNTVFAAPIALRFKGQTPWPYSSEGQVILPIDIVNVGDGSLKNSLITVHVKVENGPTLGCSGTVNVQNSPTLRCTLSGNQISLGGVPQKTFTLIAEANYTYVEKNKVAVTVEGVSN